MESTVDCAYCNASVALSFSLVGIDLDILPCLRLVIDTKD